MKRTHPARVLVGCWLVFAGILVLADCLLKPAPVTFTEAPTPTRASLTVLPTQTVYQFATLAPSPTVTPREALLSTRVPTRTATPRPTETPEPPTPSQRPVQRG